MYSKNMDHKSKKWVGVYLSQGLGNQLFSLAYIRTLMEQNNKRIILYFNRHSKDDRPFKLDFFVKLHPENIVLKVNNTLFYLFKVGLAKIFKSNRSRAKIRVFYEKDLFSYETRLLNIPNYSIVFGNYINHKYVDEIFTSLKEDLDAWIQTINLPSEFTSIYTKDATVLHIRRGDTLGPEAEKRGILSQKYYTNSIQKIYDLSGIESTKIIAITDDLSCAKLDMAALNIPFWFGPERISAEQALKIFVSCQNFIGANSTLSWWGARLSVGLPKRISVLPSPWLGFRSSNADQALLIPGVNYVRAE
jgi:hypothetical protein